MIFVTTPNTKIAERISSNLLKKKLIACANLYPVKSAYWWERKIYKHSEVVMILKTIPTKKQKVFSEIKKIHPYKLPDLTAFRVDSTKEVELWIKNSLKYLNRKNN
jgi:periplasmic divalent cation tolerance protein